jgi:hypothetical protein
MRSTFSTLALLATSLLVKNVAGRFDVRKRDMVVVTDNVIVTEEITVTEEADGSFETGLPVAIGTATIAGTPVVISSAAASSTTLVAAATTSVAPPASSSSAAASSTAGAVFLQENIPSSETSTTPVFVAPTTSAAASTPSPVASPTPAANDGTSSSLKRGLAYNDPTILSNFISGSSQVSWAYNWGSSSSGLPSGLEYVPMLWGLDDSFTSDWNSNAANAIASGSTHLLAFNEPDNPGQSNLGTAEAAAGYLQYMQPFAGQAKLGAPAVTNGGPPSGLTWLEGFISDCVGCQIDFVPIHWYAPVDDVDYFMSYIQQAYSAAGNNTPIWITEFQPSGTADQQNTFLETVLPWLDSQDYVERYSYFMAADGNLLDTGNTLSTLGETYAFFT